MWNATDGCSGKNFRTITQQCSTLAATQQADGVRFIDAAGGDQFGNSFHGFSD
jgi:hypothetical protein